MSIKDHIHKRVLIADDLPNMRIDLIKILKGMGFTSIKEVSDGKAAWDELRREAQYGNPYEIVFLDINMPLMNGLNVLKNLRELDNYKSIPIFIVSTENSKDTVLKGILSGATDYIIKPYGLEIVIAKLMTRLK